MSPQGNLPSLHEDTDGTMDRTEEQPPHSVLFEGVNPIFRVGNLEASVEYFVEVLGFKIDFQDAIASVSRGRCALFLVQGDQGHPGAWVWIGVSDVERLYDEYLAKGAKIRQPPTNFLWAREMQVEDLDGNVLRLGSEPLADQPFGPWLDMGGELWEMVAEGGWRRRSPGPEDERTP